MDDPRFIKPKQILLADLNDFNEAKLRDLIAEDPKMLCLSDDLIFLAKEKELPGGGRLDLLLADPEEGERYEVELQLGEVDESHIIRCLEYWDIERKRNPKYDHIAVLVAEDFTPRFLNVISLFNGFVPIIALKITAFSINDNNIVLNFIKVLDKVVQEEEEEPPEPIAVDRSFWVRRSSEEIVSIIDPGDSAIQTGINFRSILRDEISQTLDLKYNQQYIGIQDNGVSNVFVTFVPYKRGYIRVSVRLRRSDKVDTWMGRLADAIPDTTKNKDWIQFQLRTKQELEDNHEDLKKLFKESYNISHGKLE